MVEAVGTGGAAPCCCCLLALAEVDACLCALLLTLGC